MATYDLNRTELSSALADSGVDPSIRAEIISTLEEVGVFTSDPNSEALTSVVGDGEKASKHADAVIYTDEVSGFVNNIPNGANAIVFATDDGVVAVLRAPDNGPP